MSGDEILCDVVTSLYRSARTVLPLKGLGLVRLHSADRVVLTYLDGFGATEYRTEPGALPEAVLPTSDESRVIAVEQLETIPSGLLESRLLHSSFAPEVQDECAVRELLALPVPGLEPSTVLLLGRAEAEPPSNAQHAYIDGLARSIVDLIERVETERRDNELQLLRRLEAADKLLPAFFRVLDVRQIFNRLSEITKDVLRHDFASMGIFSEDLSEVELYVQTAEGPFEQRKGPMIFPFAQTSTWIYRLIDDLETHPLERNWESLRAGFRSSMRVAVRRDDTIMGALNFSTRQLRPYTADDVRVALRVADYAALALSHQQLAEESKRAAALQQRAANLDLIDELLATIGDGDLHYVFDRISHIARKGLAHDAMLLAVFMNDGIHARRYVTTGIDTSTLPEIIEIPEPLRDPDWDYNIVDDLTTDSMGAAQPIAQMGFRSALRMPVRLEGRIVAGLAFISRSLNAFTPDDVPAARRVAHRVALCLARERNLDAVKRAAEEAARATRLESRVQALTDELNARDGFHRVIGKSAGWRQVLTLASQVAATDTTVLLLGESGTGKEVVARFLHRGSTRKNGPFVALNCAALPEQLLESELFGYERGAFTGAITSRAGKIEQAAGGVLFLDEVAEMSPPMQAKFLRVLQEREFQRLGGTKVLRCDARVIAATNRDPKEAIQRGTMREDLYYRLGVFEISLPPLRERREDILLLVDAFLNDLAKNIGRPAAGVSADARDRLVSYSWPGNVRELRNAVERAVILCDGGLISSEHLPIAIGQLRPSSTPVTPAPNVADELATTLPPGSLKLETFERELLLKAMAQAQNNKSQAAKLLGVPRGQFYSLLKRHGMTDAKR
jgi:transcriptional regulator with GAF, ATPase, and Fis domain